MDPYTHILCLPLTSCFQTTFISGHYEEMNSVCSFLITWTARPWVIQNESYYMVLHIYTGAMHTHSNTPFRVRFTYEYRCDERLKIKNEECTRLRHWVYFVLFWIKKMRAKDKTYTWGSVWWKTQKLKLRNLHVSHTLGCVIPAVIHLETSVLRDVSFAEVGSVCRVALKEPMHLCTCVSEEGGDGEAARSETPSVPSYTLFYFIMNQESES
jgi:hypothetical protein